MKGCSAMIFVPGMTLHCLNEKHHAGDCRFEVLLSDWANYVQPILVEIEQWKRLADDAEELFSHIPDDDDVELWRRSYRAVQAGEPDPFGMQSTKDSITAGATDDCDSGVYGIPQRCIQRGINGECGGELNVTCIDCGTSYGPAHDSTESDKDSAPDVHQGRYHHPDCNYWKWDWRYSWAPSDCNCDDVAGPTLPEQDGGQNGND